MGGTVVWGCASQLISTDTESGWGQLSQAGAVFTLVSQNLQECKRVCREPLSKQKPSALAHSSGFSGLTVPQDNLITGLKANSVAGEAQPWPHSAGPCSLSAGAVLELPQLPHAHGEPLRARPATAFKDPEGDRQSPQSMGERAVKLLPEATCSGGPNLTPQRTGCHALAEPPPGRAFSLCEVQAAGDAEMGQWRFEIYS